MSKARVFLSCGQITGRDEPAIAREIARRLENECGFQCYIAVDDHSSIGLRENIFRQLELADYFIFIDFIRDEFKDGQHRGSLFSHQELAIASYLEIPILPFQESGVMKLDGMLGVIHGNALPFYNRADLPDVVINEVKKQLRKDDWTTSTRNELRFDVTPIVEEHPVIMADGSSGCARYVLIPVRNLHHRRAAVQCYAYVERIRNLGAGEDISVRTIELKWGGTFIPGIRIAAQGERLLTVLSTIRDAPPLGRFHAITDSEHFQPPSLPKGIYDLSFAITSENFPTAQKWLRVEIGDHWDEIAISEPPA